MEIFYADDEGAATPRPSGSKSTIAPMFHVPVPETRKVTQITGHAPKSAILTDLEARKEIGACKAPPKDIPRKLQRDFLSGRMNAGACLNQVCQLQRWNCKYVESTPSAAFDKYGNNNFAITAIVNGITYVAGEGRNKKLAKVCAATNALNEIFGHDPDQNPRDVDDQKRRYDSYGRAVSVPGGNAAGHLTDKRPERKPLPKPVMSQKTNFLPAPSRSQAMEMLKRKPLQPHEIVGALVERKQRALSAANCDQLGPVFHGAVSAFVVRKIGFPDEVVSLGTGDMCFHGGELRTDGRVVFDCHAETVARRGFRRYLLKQIQYWYSGDETLRKNCILEKTEDSDLLCVKEEVSVHLYLSKLPKGMARSQRNVKNIARLDECNLSSLRNSGSVEIRTTSGIPIEVAAFDVLGMEKRTMLTMSGSDKILKWNICGVQGSLLSLFIESVCLTSITVGYDGDSDGDTNSLDVAVNKRLDDALNLYLPGMFFVNHVLKIGSYVIKETASVDSMLGGRENLSVNWTTGDAAIEVLNAETGILDKSSPSSPSAEGASRISKMAFYGACLKMVADSGSSVLQPHENYHTAKISCESYRKAKRVFYDHVENKGLGQWVVRPKQVDCFNA